MELNEENNPEHWTALLSSCVKTELLSDQEEEQHSSQVLQKIEENKEGNNDKSENTIEEEKLKITVEQIKKCTKVTLHLEKKIKGETKVTMKVN